MVENLKSDEQKQKMIFSELHERLCNTRRPMAFFFGAGISVEAHVPNLEQLTKNIENNLEGKEKLHFQMFSKDHKNVEEILDLIRHLALIKKKSPDSLSDSYKEIEFDNLDKKICLQIIEEIKPKPFITDGKTLNEFERAKNHINFAKWLISAHNLHYPAVELYTTNYDIFLELALDLEQIPYSDGFLGAYRPFFRDRLIYINGEDNFEQIPRSWFRYWKLHGSINWRRKTKDGKTQVFRTNNLQDIDESVECLIQPSYFKLAETRLTPFDMLIDRFRRFLLSGEKSLFILGYGFGDEHINEILIQGIKENPNLAITIFDFGQENEVSKKVKEFALEYHNIMAIGPNSYIWERIENKWSEVDEKDEIHEFFKNSESPLCKLGAFGIFTKYLKTLSFIQDPNNEDEHE